MPVELVANWKPFGKFLSEFISFTNYWEGMSFLFEHGKKIVVRDYLGSNSATYCVTGT